MVTNSTLDSAFAFVVPTVTIPSNLSFQALTPFKANISTLGPFATPVVVIRGNVSGPLKRFSLSELCTNLFDVFSRWSRPSLLLLSVDRQRSGGCFCSHPHEHKYLCFRLYSCSGSV